MADDPFKRVRDHLAVARESLVAAGKPAASAAIGRLETIEHQLDPTHADWRGDPYAARCRLERIADDLRNLTSVRPGVATGTTKLTQDPARVLLPGVDGALEQIKSALTWLV